MTAELADADLARMASDLASARGIEAVTLGGSRARGTHSPTSDYDIGVYYTADLDTAELQSLADAWADVPTEVAPPGAWGPWVNGGAWLTVDGVAVDWILRDTARVEQQCERAAAGLFAFHAQPGHPLGFLDVSYAGEVATSVVLVDSTDVLANWKSVLDPYPVALRRALVDNTWQAGFLLDAAAKGAGKGDVAYVALCCTTATMLCAHGWHAVAGEWVTNEKGLLPGVDRLPFDTGNFGPDASDVLSQIGSTPGELVESVERLRTITTRTTTQLRAQVSCRHD